MPSGYERYYRGLEEFLLSQPSINTKIQIVGKEDPGVTGNFEVSVLPNGPLLHSKRHARQGRATSEKERMAIVYAIQELLDGNEF